VHPIQVAVRREVVGVQQIANGLGNQAGLAAAGRTDDQHRGLARPAQQLREALTLTFSRQAERQLAGGGARGLVDGHAQQRRQLSGAGRRRALVRFSFGAQQAPEVRRFHLKAQADELFGAGAAQLLDVVVGGERAREVARGGERELFGSGELEPGRGSQRMVS
jgi:hypothetical protein